MRLIIFNTQYELNCYLNLKKAGVFLKFVFRVKHYALPLRFLTNKSLTVMKAQHLIFFAALSFMLLASPALLAQESSLFHTQGEPLLNKPKTDFGLQLGSSFSTGFAGSSLFSQSLAPHFQFNPSQRFSLVLGSVFSTGQFSGNSGFSPIFFSPAGTGNLMNSQRLISTTVYALGAYQASPRLTLFGGSWMERNNFQPNQPQMNSQAFNLNPRGMMMGFDYRVTENFSFGAQINVAQGYNPFNPFYNQGAFHRGGFSPSPFYRNPNW